MKDLKRDFSDRRTSEETFVSKRGEELRSMEMILAVLEKAKDDPALQKRAFEALKETIDTLVPKVFLEFFSQVSTASGVDDLDPKTTGQVKKLLKEKIYGEKPSPLDLVNATVRKWELGINDYFSSTEDSKLKSLIPLLPQTWYEVLHPYEQSDLADQDKEDVLNKLTEAKLIVPLFELGEDLNESLKNFVKATERDNRLLEWPGASKSLDYLSQIILKRSLPIEALQLEIVRLTGRAVSTHDSKLLMGMDIGNSVAMNWPGTFNSILRVLADPDNKDKSIKLEGVTRYPASPSGGNEYTYLRISTTEDGNILIQNGRNSPIEGSKLKAQLESMGLTVTRDKSNLDLITIHLT